MAVTNQREAVNQAYKVLERLGVPAVLLWSHLDVTEKYECDIDTAHELLEEVFMNDWLCGRINEMIDDKAEEFGLELKEGAE